MFSKLEASQMRTAFWTAFGQYMAPIKGADGEKLNWINYKTGEKDIFFRMKAEGNAIMMAIEVTHKDESLRQVYFQQFLALKNILHKVLDEEWIWEEEVMQEGKNIGRIYKRLDGATIFKKGDWPMIISFFKQRIMALDLFWSSARYAFEILR